MYVFEYYELDTKFKLWFIKSVGRVGSFLISTDEINLSIFFFFVIILTINVTYVLFRVFHAVLFIELLKCTYYARDINGIFCAWFYYDRTLHKLSNRNNMNRFSNKLRPAAIHVLTTTYLMYKITVYRINKNMEQLKFG